MKDVLKNLGVNLNTCQFESPSHMGTLLSGLNALRSKGLLLDITLIAGGKYFKAHRVVLASCSDYFRAMFTDEMKESRLSEICLNGVSAEGMKYLLDYAYTSKLALSLSNIQDVLSAASHVQLLAVIEACSSYLEEQLDIDNCIDIAALAETYSLRTLRKKVYLFMCRHLKEFSQTTEFQRLAPSQLEHLLETDFPVNCPEWEVLQIVLKWIEACPQDRIKFSQQLARFVHFADISSCHRKELYRSNLLKCLLSSSPLINKIWTLTEPNYLCPHQSTNNDSLVNSRGMELSLLKVGGFGISGITNEVTYFQNGSKKWRYLTSIPHVEQCNYGTAVLNNELFVVGGCFNQNQSLQENVHPFGFKFNPMTNSWSTMAPMQKERCRFSLSVVGHCLFAVGGVGESGDLESTDQCERYNCITDSWSSITHIPRARAQHAGVSFKQYLFISGGLEQDLVLNCLYRYDTETDQWEAKAPLLTPRADHSMVCYKDKLYISGGWHEDETTGTRVLVDSIDCYNIYSDSWETVTNVPTPRYHAGIVVIGSWLYIVGGFHSDTTFDRASGVVECYNMETNIWTVGAHYPQDIWEHSCATLFVPRCRDDLEVIADRSLL